jgi:hypothetical protein
MDLRPTNRLIDKQWNYLSRMAIKAKLLDRSRTTTRILYIGSAGIKRKSCLRLAAGRAIKNTAALEFKVRPTNFGSSKLTHNLPNSATSGLLNMPVLFGLPDRPASNKVFGSFPPEN